MHFPVLIVSDGRPCVDDIMAPFSYEIDLDSPNLEWDDVNWLAYYKSPTTVKAILVNGKYRRLLGEDSAVPISNLCLSPDTPLLDKKVWGIYHDRSRASAPVPCIPSLERDGEITLRELLQSCPSIAASPIKVSVADDSEIEDVTFKTVFPDPIDFLKYFYNLDDGNFVLAEEEFVPSGPIMVLLNKDGSIDSVREARNPDALYDWYIVGGGFSGLLPPRKLPPPPLPKSSAMQGRLFYKKARTSKLVTYSSDPYADIRNLFTSEAMGTYLWGDSAGESSQGLTSAPAAVVDIPSLLRNHHIEYIISDGQLLSSDLLASAVAALGSNAWLTVIDCHS